MQYSIRHRAHRMYGVPDLRSFSFFGPENGDVVAGQAFEVIDLEPEPINAIWMPQAPVGEPAFAVINNDIEDASFYLLFYYRREEKSIAEGSLEESFRAYYNEESTNGEELEWYFQVYGVNDLPGEYTGPLFETRGQDVYPHTENATGYATSPEGMAKLLENRYKLSKSHAAFYLFGQFSDQNKVVAGEDFTVNGLAPEPIFARWVDREPALGLLFIVYNQDIDGAREYLKFYYWESDVGDDPEFLVHDADMLPEGYSGQLFVTGGDQVYPYTGQPVGRASSRESLVKALESKHELSGKHMAFWLCGPENGDVVAGEDFTVHDLAPDPIVASWAQGEPEWEEPLFIIRNEIENAEYFLEFFYREESLAGNKGPVMSFEVRGIDSALEGYSGPLFETSGQEVYPAKSEFSGVASSREELASLIAQRYTQAENNPAFSLPSLLGKKLIVGEDFVVGDLMADNIESHWVSEAPEHANPLFTMFVGGPAGGYYAQFYLLDSTAGEAGSQKDSLSFAVHSVKDLPELPELLFKNYENYVYPLHAGEPPTRKHRKFTGINIR
ncbi:hypothetical protein ACWGKU_39260 [Kitasatospora sp. NPDC054768]